jgi:hypothetical protein
MIQPYVHAPDGRLELEPDLPMTVYDAMERWHPDRIGAAAVYCSDGRWGDALDEFCHRHLLIPRYDRLAVPGGPAWLADTAEDSAMLRAARIQLGFLVQAHSLERLVLITHFGCAWYSQKLQQPQPTECLPAQIDDVRTAAATITSWFDGLRVDTYLAMRRDDRVSFHELPTQTV